MKWTNYTIKRDHIIANRPIWITVGEVTKRYDFYEFITLWQYIGASFDDFVKIVKNGESEDKKSISITMSRFQLKRVKDSLDRALHSTRFLVNLGIVSQDDFETLESLFKKIEVHIG